MSKRMIVDANAAAFAADRLRAWAPEGARTDAGAWARALTPTSQGGDAVEVALGVRREGTHWVAIYAEGTPNNCVAHGTTPDEALGILFRVVRQQAVLDAGFAALTAEVARLRAALRQIADDPAVDGDDPIRELARQVLDG